MAKHQCNKDKEIEQIHITQATMTEKINNIEEKVGNIEHKIDGLPEVMKELFVSKAEFAAEQAKNSLVRKVVFGFVSVALVAIATGLISLIV